MEHRNEPLAAPVPLPELCCEDPRRYHMNMDWIWSLEHNPELQAVAMVRVVIFTKKPLKLEERLNDWTDHLHGPDSQGAFVYGGWFCQRESTNNGSIVLVFGSSGQDAAESLDHGIQWFSGAVLRESQTTAVIWEELPLTDAVK